MNANPFALSAPGPWLLLLLAAWAALLFGGFLFGKSTETNRRMPRWTRLGSSAVLVIAAWSWALLARQTAVLPFVALVALGMSFGFLGDCFVAGALPGGKAAGIGSFALDHICTIGGILWLSGLLVPLGPARALPVYLAWWLVALLGWYGVVYRPATAASRLHWLVLPYAILLATTAATASGLALQAPVFWPLDLGAALFLLSDIILGGVWFGGLDWPYAHDLIWLTYGSGQMLIVYASGIALGLASLPG